MSTNDKTRAEKDSTAANLIRQSSQPLIVLGGGAIVSEAYKEVTELVNYLEIPIATTLMGKGIIDENSSSFVRNARNAWNGLR